MPTASTRRGLALLMRAAMALCLSGGCHEDDQGETASAGVPTTSESSPTTDSMASAENESTGANVAMEVDCTDAPSESIPVCLPRRDDGGCTDAPDEVELCRGTCFETCCFEVESVACGPDVAQTDRCCYWILVGEMSCADSPEETCVAD